MKLLKDGVSMKPYKVRVCQYCGNSVNMKTWNWYLKALKEKGGTLTCCPRCLRNILENYKEMIAPECYKKPLEAYPYMKGGRGEFEFLK